MISLSLKQPRDEKMGSEESNNLSTRNLLGGGRVAEADMYLDLLLQEKQMNEQTPAE